MPQSKLGNIKLLDQSVISMIAAGEVVERPASALKELIENAIDSGATSIDVDLEEGGINMIKVADDGSGMRADDMALAVQPHTTSKINTISDLDDIKTLGFRGEALASISSLSNMTIRSCPHDADDGATLSLNGSWQGEGSKPCVARPGTEITVRDLFSHAPARRKFLRKPATEWAHCEVMFQTLAIGNPQVEFSLSRSGKKRIELPVQDHRSRVLAVMGGKFASDAQEIVHEAGPLSLAGYLSLSSTSASGRQFLFLNGRAIKDRLLRHAIRKAFTDVARQPDFPYALFLQMPAPLVDVNAHPTKTEVRFKESNAIFSFTHSALSKVANMPVGINPDIALESSGRTDRQVSAQASSAPRAFVKSRPGRSSIAAMPGISLGSAAAASGFSPLPPVSLPDHEDNSKTQQPPAELGRVIGMLRGIYLLTENDEGLTVIDVHAAHERILYERLKSTSKDTPAQNLLQPIELNLSPLEMDAVVEHREQLAAHGLHVSNVDGVEALVAIPKIISDKDIDPAKLVLECIEEIVECGKVSSAEETANKVLGTMACHAAVRGSNPFLANDDLAGLLSAMELTFRSGKCNHGRPCWRTLKFSELDNFFERGK